MFVTTKQDHMLLGREAENKKKNDSVQQLQVIFMVYLHSSARSQDTKG